MQKNHHVPTRHSTRLDCHMDKIPYEVLSLVMENLEEYKQLDTLRAVSRRFMDVSEDILGRSIQRMQAQIVQEVASAKTEFEEKLEVFLAIPQPTYFDGCIIEMTGKKVHFMQEIQAHFRNLNALLWSRRPACASAYINCGKLLDCVTDAIQKVKEMPEDWNSHTECHLSCDLLRKPYVLSKLRGETDKYTWKISKKLSQEMEDYEGSSITSGHDGVEYTMSGLLLKYAYRFIGLLNLMENSILANMNFALVHYNPTGLARIKAQYDIPSSIFTLRKNGEDTIDVNDTCINFCLEEIFKSFGRIVSSSNLECLIMENHFRCKRFQPDPDFEVLAIVNSVVGKSTDSEETILQFECAIPTRSNINERFMIEFDFTCASGLISTLLLEKCERVEMKLGKVQTFDMMITAYDPECECDRKFVASYKTE